MTINDVLIFDTETTGVPERSAKWETDYMDYPHIVQLAWIFRGRVENHIIMPDGWEIPQAATEIHGITNEYALEHGEPFAFVVDMFIKDCLEAGLICGHNIHFDTGIVKANILRELGQRYYDMSDVETALYKGKRIDTMRPAMKWVDARMADGRLKFPNLTELFSRCFPGQTFQAHNAVEDCNAVALCLPVLLDNGIVELKVKDYPAEQQKIDFAEAARKQAESGKVTFDEAAQAVKEITNAQESPKNGPILDVKQKDDKCTVETLNVAKNENLAEISIASELLEQNDF